MCSTIDSARVTLASTFNTVDLRSAALGSVIGALAAEGRIPGWRNETYAIRNAFDAPPLAYIERAASRFFGTMTYAVHLNGVVEYADGARRRAHRNCGSRAAATPRRPIRACSTMSWRAGSAGASASRRRIIKECWEEAGIPEEIAARAVAGRTAHVLQSLPEGTQAEQIFIYDLALPADFAPRNQDGEVGEHRLARIDEAARWIEEGAMTVDASLATLDCLLRRRWIDEDACAGIEALFVPPVFA